MEKKDLKPYEILYINRKGWEGTANIVRSYMNLESAFTNKCKEINQIKKDKSHDRNSDKRNN